MTKIKKKRRTRAEMTAYRAEEAKKKAEVKDLQIKVKESPPSDASPEFNSLFVDASLAQTQIEPDMVDNVNIDPVRYEPPHGGFAMIRGDLLEALRDKLNMPDADIQLVMKAINRDIINIFEKYNCVDYNKVIEIYLGLL